MVHYQSPNVGMHDTHNAAAATDMSIVNDNARIPDRNNHLRYHRPPDGLSDVSRSFQELSPNGPPDCYLPL